MMSEELKWFRTADFGEYEGKYVAIVGKAVVAAGDDPKAVFEEAERKAKGKEIVLWKVPKQELLILVLAWR